MANAAPATVTITGSTGPGQAVTTLKFTDVNEIRVDFLRNLLAITRAGAGGITYYDYSALGTSITWTVTGGAGGGPSVILFS
jgi:hypothetical protein